jgi:DNA polymerase III epsilon subunit-like protein
MRILVFDTETTGLVPRQINYINKEWYKDSKLPYIVQLSWLLVDTDNDKILNKGDYIIKLHPSIIIPDVCIKVHGISNELSQKEGIPIQKVLPYFIMDYKYADIIVCHNLDFDMKMIKIELLRNNYGNIIDSLNKNTYCTMKNSIELCAIERTNSMGKYFKYPKLIELHKKLFNTEPKNLHNSFNDVIVCLRCYYKLVHNEDFVTKSYNMKELMKLIM